MLPTRWYPDELIHAGPEHLEGEYVARYDAKAASDPQPDVEWLRMAGLPADGLVVDIGAGTGGFAMAVAPFCRQVIAVDVSPAMVGFMRQVAAQRAIPTVEVVQGGFLSYEHRHAPADAVYSRNALHHLPDFWKGVALTRIAAMLRPGGLFLLRDLIFSCALAEVPTVVEAWLAKASATDRYGWTREELETHLREEYSTFTWLLEPLLGQAGLDIEEAATTPSQIYTAYLCRKRR